MSEALRPGAGAGFTENIVQLFMLALEAGERGGETKIFHCNGDPVTNEWASKLIAQAWQQKTSITGGSSLNVQGESENNGFSFAEQLAAQVLPIEFTVLRKGGRLNHHQVDGIAFQSGRVWNASGTNFLHVTFPQT